MVYLFLFFILLFILLKKIYFYVTNRIWISITIDTWFLIHLQSFFSNHHIIISVLLTKKANICALQVRWQNSILFTLSHTWGWGRKKKKIFLITLTEAVNNRLHMASGYISHSFSHYISQSWCDLCVCFLMAASALYHTKAISSSGTINHNFPNWLHEVALF